MMRLRDLFRRWRRTEPPAPTCTVDPMARRLEEHEESARNLIARMTPDEQRRLRMQRARAEAALEYRDIAVQGRDWWPW